MKVVVAGASGFIGQALVSALRADGDEVRRLVRHGPDASDAISWNPAAQVLDPRVLEDVDAVVNLAGENISAGRWTRTRRERLRSSRIDPTRTLVTALAQLRSARPVLLNASAVGCYGDRGDAEVSESSALGEGFLADLCRAWEQETEMAPTVGIRAVRLRLGVVLGPNGGALAKMVPMFRSGFGGRLGSGRQWMSWIHRDDVVSVIRTALSDSRYQGPLNAVAPQPVTNAQFTAALARALHRPAWLPAPAWALRLAFGRMADEALLASTRAVPTRLESLGYAFKYPTLDAALAASVRA